MARQLTRKFGFRKVAFTLRTSLSANDNDWMGMLYNGEKDHAEFSPQYHLHIVDRVGGQLCRWANIWNAKRVL